MTYKAGIGIAMVALAALWLWAGGSVGLREVRAAGQGCDIVPADYANRVNPTPELEGRRLRYWGKQYKAKCARCHGEDGSGGGEEAGRQAIPPANFTDTAFMAKCSDGQLFYQIIVGGEQKSAMPAFGPRSDQGWSEAKVWEMVTYIRRFAR